MSLLFLCFRRIRHRRDIAPPRLTAPSRRAIVATRQAKSLAQAKAPGFRVMQFNAVVASNCHARHLYERLGFVALGIVPGGFRMKDGSYQDICLYYHTL